MHLSHPFDCWERVSRLYRISYWALATCNRNGNLQFATYLFTVDDFVKCFFSWFLCVFSIQSSLLGWMHFCSFAQFTTIFCAPCDLCRITLGQQRNTHSSIQCSLKYVFIDKQRRNGRDTKNQMNEAECRIRRHRRRNEPKKANTKLSVRAANTKWKEK